MGQNASSEAFFNVNAKLEEQKKTNSQAELTFNLLIETKPNLVKYMVTGIVKLEGNMQDINKRLEVNPKTKIPQILFTVYQHVFGSIYLLSSVLDTPYPPPDLLHPMQEKIQILPKSTENEMAQPQQEKKIEPSQPTKMAETPEKAAQEKVFTEKSATEPEAAKATNAKK